MCGCAIINMWLQLLLHWLGLFHLVLRGKWAYTWVNVISTPTASLRTTYMCNYLCHLESKGCGVLRGCMGEHCKEFTSWAEQIPWSRVHVCARRWVSDSLTVLGPTCGHLFQLGPQQKSQRTSESWPFQLQIHLHPPTLGGLCLLSPHTPATHPVLKPENMPTHARAYAILGPNTLCVIGKLRPQRGRHWFRAQYVGRRDFPASSVIKNLPASAGEAGDVGSVLELGRFPGGGNGNPRQSSCLENPTDRRCWWAAVQELRRVGHDWATEYACACVGRIQKKSDDSNFLGHHSIPPSYLVWKWKPLRSWWTRAIPLQLRPFISLHVHNHRGVHKQKQTPQLGTVGGWLRKNRHNRSDKWERRGKLETALPWIRYTYCPGDPSGGPQNDGDSRNTYSPACAWAISLVSPGDMVWGLTTHHSQIWETEHTPYLLG